MTCGYGLGLHLEEMLEFYPLGFQKQQFYQWVYTTFMLAAIAIGKIAIVVFILEIEGSALKNSRRYILYVIAVLNTLLTIGIIPIIWLQCDPMPKLWNNEIPGSCAGRQRNEYYAYFQGSMYPDPLPLDFVETDSHRLGCIDRCPARTLPSPHLLEPAASLLCEVRSRDALWLRYRGRRLRSNQDQGSQFPHGNG